MSFRFLARRAAGLTATGGVTARMAVAPASSLAASGARVALPARGVSTVLSSPVRTPEDLVASDTEELAQSANASGAKRTFNNTRATMPLPRIAALTNTPAVPVNWSHLGAQDQAAVYKRMLADYKEAGAVVAAEDTQTHVVGDAAVTAARTALLLERQALSNVDVARATLRSQDRASPIYANVQHARQRTPRVPLPSDTGMDISPTAGLLHLYRLHHANMFLQQEQRRAELEEIRGWVDVRAVDCTLAPVEGADNAGLQSMMDYIQHHVAMFGGLSTRDRAELLLTVRALIPECARVEKKVVVKARRRRN